MPITRRHAPLALLGWVLLATFAAGCPFDPKIPSARVLCTNAADCPSGYTCEAINSVSQPGLAVCCKERGCAQGLPDAAVQQLENAARDAAAHDVPADVGMAVTCGNGRMDPGETCDPPSSCPTACPQVGCETYELQGSASTCNAVCVLKGTQTTCVSGDSCCPSGCTGAQDSDCSCTCGNGMIETACGEVCDPASTCPTTCAQQGCMLRRVANPGTCTATCVNDHLQTSCISGDGCCPASCNASNDSDCLPTCGNAAVEQGESCDPPGTCPTTCPAIGCTKRKLVGTAANCTAHCVDDGAQTACATGDGCCPSGCTTANDSDCSCTCGNSKLEAACQETCDPLSSCPTSCPPMGCQQRRLINGNTCQAQCVDDVVQTACANGDGCCPAACNANVDNDCTAHCGNGAVEAGETCDPPSHCPATCPWNGCMRKRLTGSAAACTAACVDDGAQSACANGDGCCPTGCNSTNDNDCAPRCGDGIVDAGEKCDGNCPATCPRIGCQNRKLQGTAQACSAECVNDTLIATCGNGDGCCPSGCTTANDNDCACQCGNGVTEAACSETCDGANCPASCPPVGCQVRTLQGTAQACTAKCVNTTLISTCVNGDGCCPPACNANNDNNCTALCGNSVVEAGEQCDPPSACQIQYDACVSDNNTIRTRTGSVAACTFACTTSARQCSATSDGFCPSACPPCPGSCGTGQDVDCVCVPGCLTICHTSFLSNGCGGSCPPTCNGCCNSDTECFSPPMECF